MFILKLHVSCSGVTLLCAAPLLIEICRPYPPLKFCVPKKKKKKRSVTIFAAPTAFCRPLKQKWYPKYFFHVDRTLNWTGKYTNKALFP